MKTEDITQLEHELYKVRQLSLQATRNDDFRAVATLTLRAAKLNDAIMQVKGEKMAAEIGASAWRV